MTSVLDGVRVLDVSAGMPGAIVTMLLADYGADVIHIDPPVGTAPGTYRSLRTWRRGRRRLALDLRSPGDRAIVLTLAGDADIIVIELQPDIADELGLGVEALTEANPDAIIVAITGFGLDDERTTPPIDVLVAAELGAMVAATPANRSGPVFLGHPAVAYSTALVASIGTLAALRARIKTGRGDVVDASLLDGLLAQYTMNWWTERNISFLADRRTDGQLDLGRTRMLVRRYTCADGRMIQVHTGAPGAFGRLMTLVGLADDVSKADGPVEPATPLTDDDQIALERLPEIFATRSSADWLADIWANEIAALPVLAPGEAFHDGQVRHGGLITTVPDPEFGSIEVVAPPLTLSQSAGRTSEPDRDVHDRSAFCWLASGLPAGPTEPADLLATALADGPLTGIRIVELSTFFASPYANRLLRDLGAEVIKVEAIAGDPMRSLPDPFEGATHGKRAIAMDLKASATRPVVEALLRGADVVQHNFRPGAAERLGIDSSTVRALNSDVVYDYAPGYGSTGPKSRLQSFAPLHSGFVGIQVEAAGEGNVPTITFGNEDYYNGQLNAVGTLLALIHRQRTGVGQDVECAQLSSSVFVTSHWYLVNGEPRTDGQPLDHEQYGWSPYQRIYQCLEGYVCVCCASPEDELALRRAVLDSEPHDNESHDNERLEYEFFGRNADEWIKVLREYDVPCTVVTERMWLLDFLADPATQAAGRATRFEHHQHGQVSVIGQIVRLASTPPREPARAPRLGEHTADVLLELGFDEALIHQLAQDGLIVLGTP